MTVRTWQGERRAWTGHPGQDNQDSKEGEDGQDKTARLERKDRTARRKHDSMDKAARNGQPWKKDSYDRTAVRRAVRTGDLGKDSCVSPGIDPGYGRLPHV
jgi:hypothetical protein